LVVIDPIGGELVVYAWYVPATDAIAVEIVSIGFGVTPCDCFNLVDLVVTNQSIDSIFAVAQPITQLIRSDDLKYATLDKHTFLVVFNFPDVHSTI
jgi:hypothetical protein